MGVKQFHERIVEQCPRTMVVLSILQFEQQTILVELSECVGHLDTRR